MEEPQDPPWGHREGWSWVSVYSKRKDRLRGSEGYVGASLILPSPINSDSGKTREEEEGSYPFSSVS